MTVRVAKPAFNVREKLSELDVPVGTHGSQLMKSADAAESFDLVRAGRKNMLINGNMVIDQRNLGNSAAIGTYYYLDRWEFNKSNDGAATCQKVDDAPPDFKSSLKFTTTTADTSAAAGQYMYLRQMIEGHDFKQAAFGTGDAKTITFSFYVKSSLVGLFGGAVWNNSFDKCYPYDYTINTANTWERKSITIPGCPDGTWEKGTGRGISIGFVQLCGSTYTGTVNSWGNTAKLGPTNHTNIMATNGSTWQITGLQVELGSVATPYEHRSYAEELALCQRYFYGINNTVDQFRGIGFGGGPNWATCVLYFPTVMRENPDATAVNSGSMYFNNGTSAWSSSSLTFNTSIYGATFGANMSGSTKGEALSIYTTNSNVKLNFEAEL